MCHALGCFSSAGALPYPYYSILGRCAIFFNDYKSAKTAGLVAVTLVKAGKTADEHLLSHSRKRYDANTGVEAASETTAFTPAQLKAQKTGLRARIAEIDALLADVAGMKIALAPIEEVIPG